MPQQIVCYRSEPAATSARQLRPLSIRSWGYEVVADGGLLLAGCAGREPEMRTVRVEIPVPVPCRVPMVPVPAWVTGCIKKDDSLELKVRALLAERRQRIGYEKQLEASSSVCR
ncbi:hypothetical protein [Pseudomonas chlororaphis]|uniref:hypothetical protein n=1 Tax=Pseudomonas chlororaphis TaxID=587753 RepID=UPI0039E1EB56